MKKYENKNIILFCLCLLLPLLASGQTAKFVLFPDTQTYLESCPEILEQQVNAITKDSRQYAALIHLGDMTFTFENVNF